MNWWHRTGRVPGFLLFHWYAIKNLKRCGADKILGATIEPFTEEEWLNMEWPYQLENDVQEGDIQRFLYQLVTPKTKAQTVECANAMIGHAIECS